MLVFQNAIKGYGANKALNNVNVTFENGKVYALVGPNGSGKSTLMKVAAGLVKLSGGSCTYNNVPVGTATKSRIAYMSTEPFYYNWMRISDVEKFYTDFFEDFQPKRFRELLQFMQLTSDLKVKSLSSGMAAKLKIAATMARNAEVIMLDEPLNGIDMLAREEIIRAIIDSINPNTTMIISSHLFDELETIVEDVVMMKNGIPVVIDNLEQIRENTGKSLVDIYRDVYSN